MAYHSPPLPIVSGNPFSTQLPAPDWACLKSRIEGSAPATSEKASSRAQSRETMRLHMLYSVTVTMQTGGTRVMVSLTALTV